MIFGYSFRFKNSRQNYNYDLRNLSISTREKKIVLYLNSIVNYKIWTYSQKIHKGELIFDRKNFLSSICKTVYGRIAMQNGSRLRQCQKIDDLDRLIGVLKQAFFPPTGVG